MMDAFSLAKFTSQSQNTKNKYAMEHLPNLFRQYDLITVSTEDALAFSFEGKYIMISVKQQCFIL